MPITDLSKMLLRLSKMLLRLSNDLSNFLDIFNSQMVLNVLDLFTDSIECTYVWI